jgi:hypothetical protein
MRNDVNKSIEADWLNFLNSLYRFKGWVEHNRDQLWSLKSPISEEDWNNIDQLEYLLERRVQAADDIRWMLEGLENHIEEMEMFNDDISSRIDQIEAEEVA